MTSEPQSQRPLDHWPVETMGGGGIPGGYCAGGGANGGWPCGGGGGGGYSWEADCMIENSLCCFNVLMVTKYCVLIFIGTKLVYGCW